MGVEHNKVQVSPCWYSPWFSLQCGGFSFFIVVWCSLWLCVVCHVLCVAGCGCAVCAICCYVACCCLLTLGLTSRHITQQTPDGTHSQQHTAHQQQSHSATTAINRYHTEASNTHCVFFLKPSPFNGQKHNFSNRKNRQKNWHLANSTQMLFHKSFCYYLLSGNRHCTRNVNGNMPGDALLQRMPVGTEDYRQRLAHWVFGPPGA